MVTLKGKVKGLSKEISVDTCRSALLEGECLLSFGKMEYAIHYALVQGVSSNLLATSATAASPTGLGHYSFGDGSGDASVKKSLVM